MNKSFIKIYLLSIFSLMALVSISCGNKTTASKGLEHYAGTWTMTGNGFGGGDLTIGTDGSIEIPEMGKFTKDKIKDNGGDEYEFSLEQSVKTTIKFKFTSDTEGTVTLIASAGGQSQEAKGTLKKK